MVKLKDKLSGEIVDVRVSSRNRIGKDSVTGTREVVFGKKKGDNKEYAFRIPTRFVKV